MAQIDIAGRVYDHSFRMDPILRSLLDNDFYKLLMMQMIWLKHRGVKAKFSLINRSKKIRIADIVDEVELREQLDHARTLRFTRGELIHLAGATFAGMKHIFRPDFLAWLANYQLPEYELEKDDGQYVMTFPGDWADDMYWEVGSLAIIGELRSRAAMKGMGRIQLDILYSNAKSKLWRKIERLQKLAQELAPDATLKIADMGTRRRHSFLWQRWVCQAMVEGLGSSFIGTSNTLLAKELNIEAIGTNAHELSMAYAALAGDDPQAVRDSRYQVCADWAELYDGRLLVVLPDAYGTTQFLDDAPAWLAKWTAGRLDSKDPIVAGDEIIDFWRRHGENPREKLLIPSDGLDVDTIESTARHFRGKTNLSHGWGTMATNDFIGCDPRGGDALDPISLVCKITEVNGRPAVKLSDNPAKATGQRSEIDRYLKIFGTAGMADQLVVV